MALSEKRARWYIDYYHQGRRVPECIDMSKQFTEGINQILCIRPA